MTVSKSHRIEGTDDLLFQTIKDQASSLEHGWRELLQNSIDAPGSTRAVLEYDDDHTVVHNDGDPVNLGEEEGIELLTHLGKSSKDRDSDNTIGQFGVGFGQAVAKGRTTFVSDGVALHFDIEGWGLEVQETTVENAVGFLQGHSQGWAETVKGALSEHDDYGALVVVSHYENEVPAEYSYKWGVYQDRVEKRFKFTKVATGVDIVVNGENVSDNTPSDDIELSYNAVETFHGETTGPVHIAVEHGVEGELSVYSNGVYVKDIDSRGLVGNIVTEKNLSLNFARNEIQSGCERWDEISERLDEIRREIFTTMPDDRLSVEARKWVADEMFGGGELNEDYADVKVFKTSNESYVSFNDIQEEGSVGMGSSGDTASDKLTEALGALILDSNDPTVRKIPDNDHLEEMGVSGIDTFDPKEVATQRGLFTGHQHVSEEELTHIQARKLEVARELADRLGIDREIKWGRSDVSKAWTDGRSEIYVTDSAAPSEEWVAWVPEMYRELMHEWSHTESTMEGCSNHGRFFDERYRQNIDRNWSVLSDFMAETMETSLSAILGEEEDVVDVFMSG